MSRIKWESEKGRLLQDQATAVVCHPMCFEGSLEDAERECEDHDGFFEPWSHEKLKASPTNGLEITVGFLAVKASNIPGKRIFELPHKLLSSWDLTEDKILSWANLWWTQGNEEATNYIPKFVLYPKAADEILADSEDSRITNIKENCKFVVELTEDAGSVTGRFGYSVFDEERAQLTLNLKDTNKDYRQHTVVHEFGHVLGLKHEHQRSDFWQGIYRFTDFNAIGGEQFSERKETKGVYDNYTTYDPLSVMHYFWRLEYFKKQYRQWLEPQSARKLQIAKKRLNLEISATEEMVLMSMCDQLHKVKALKYFVESKGAFNNEWVLATQLIPMKEDVPLPKRMEDIPEKGVKAWIKLVSGRQKQKSVTIRKVEYITGSTDCKSGSHYINDDYKFIVEPSSKDIKLVNWAYNTENKPPRPYSLPKPPPPVVVPIQPTASGKAMNFKIHLEPFDKSYGDLGDYKIIVVTGNPLEHELAPTEAQITNKILPKSTGQSKNARVFVAHTEAVSKLKDVVIDEMATPSEKPDEDDCYYIFIRVYAPDGKVFRDSNTVPLFELKSAERARLCYENLKKRAKSEIEVAIFAPQPILDEKSERIKLKKEVLKLLEDIKLPENFTEKYEFSPFTNTFVQQLVKAMEFLLHFRGRHCLPFQLINKIGLLSPELKNDIALYNAAFEVEELKAVEVAFKEYHSVEISSDGPTHTWRFSSDESFRRAIPAGHTKLRVLIEINKNQYLFERLLTLGRKLSGGKQFYTHEMYTSEHKLYIVFLMPLVEDKDQKKAFRDRVQPKVVSEFGIMEVVQVSRENKQTVIYSNRVEADTARRPRKRRRKVPATSEQEGMLSLLSSMKRHCLGRTAVTSRVEADSGMESTVDLVLKHAPQWKAVARGLGFSDKRVERIESDYLEPERCLHVIIWKWLHNNKWKSNDKIPIVDKLKTVIKKVSHA